MGLYSVVEFEFNGPYQNPIDAPARDIDFWVKFQHEDGLAQYKIHGFWDGDGKGDISGNKFKVRFCPTKTGRWKITEVCSNTDELADQRQGESFNVASSDHPGFWLVDPESAGQRWYKRSDGSHQYIFGNTHYSFLSGYKTGNIPSGNDITQDIRTNAEYFKKLRFSLYGDHYPNPEDKPFFDDSGNLTDWGNYCHRPNPGWFNNRCDIAVRTAYETELIADLILAGPDTEESRSTLRAAHNNGDPTPFLKYIAARYGCYPNVWICLCNEFDIKNPSYSEEYISQLGMTMLEFLAYPIPLSVHAAPRRQWSQSFDDLPQWHDHHIIQKKLKTIATAADSNNAVWENPHGKDCRMKPTINDELSYEGEGDKHAWDDTVESHLGAFLGGGYATTGEKPGNKTGQYFRGNFNPQEHRAASHLKWLREIIDGSITFWKMFPDTGIFSNLDPGFCAMSWPENEYVLGTDKAHQDIIANLPSGRWRITRHDVIAMESTVLADNVEGKFSFNSPESRTVLFQFKKMTLRN